jgi:DNA-directed RNA polymerase subunit beta'
MQGCFRSLAKFQLILVNSIQAIYQSQGVNISNKHIEIIVKQMTSKVVMKQSGATPLLPGELIRIGLIYEIYKSLKVQNQKTCYIIPKYQPILISATASSLNKDGFLSAAGFQETKRILTKAAIEGSCDWLRGLKECIILGRLIPAGSTFLNYKNYLDNVYLFKN